SHGGLLTIVAKKGPEPHRPARPQPGGDSPPYACNEPRKAGFSTRPHLPAGAEVREGHAPQRGQPSTANRSHPAGASSSLLRGRTEHISATGLRKRVIDGRD